MRYLIIVLLLSLVCLSSISCAYISKDGRFFLGYGHVKRSPEGEVTEIESKSPIDFPSLKWEQ